MPEFPEYIKNLAGTQLRGNYTIRTDDYGLPIRAGKGEGASAYILQVSDRQGTLYAVKILKLERMGSSSVLQRFLDEFQKQKRAKHPNIVSIFDSHEVATSDNKGQYKLPYYVMEYVDGKQIDDWAIDQEKNNAYLSLTSVSSLIEQIIAALSCAHNLTPPLYHLDLKPANILISKEGIAKVGDFGLALAESPSQIISGASLSGRPIEAMHPEFRRMFADGIDTSKLRPAFDFFGLGYTLSRIGDYLRHNLDEFSRYIFNAMVLRFIVADKNAVEQLKYQHSTCTSYAYMDTDIPEYENAQEVLETISKLGNPKYHLVNIPELQIENPQTPPIRISGHTHVPTTERLRAIIDTSAFQRLGWMKQLDQIVFTYPGATHTRCEHAFGVYYYTLRYLRRLLQEPYFVFHFSCADIKATLLAGLLHDIGHYPMAHSINESEELSLHLSHENIGRQILINTDPVFISKDEQRELLHVIEHDWAVNPQRIADIAFEVKEPNDTNGSSNSLPGHIENEAQNNTNHYEARRLSLLHSIIDGPLDVDKMHYLQCDSTHTGNPVGANFDAEQLIDSLCISEDYDELAITYKGISAVESFMYARYRMYMDVYWHHTVRCVRKMIARAIDRYIREDRNTRKISIRRSRIKMLATHSTDRDFLQLLLHEFKQESEAGKIIRHLINYRSEKGICIIRPQRYIFKRLRTFWPDSKFKAGKIFTTLTPGGIGAKIDILEYESEIASQLSKLIGTEIEPWEIILDIPASAEGKRMEEATIRLPKIESVTTFESLSTHSAVARAIKDDFINNSRVIQLYCSPRIAERIPGYTSTSIDSCIKKAIDKVMKEDKS